MWFLSCDDGSVSGLDELGCILSGLTGTTVNLLQDLGELAGDVSGVAIQHGRVSVGYLGWMWLLLEVDMAVLLIYAGYCVDDTEWIQHN